MKLTANFHDGRQLEVSLPRLSLNGTVEAEIDGKPVRVTLLREDRHAITLEVDGRRFTFRNSDGNSGPSDPATLFLHENRPYRVRVESKLDRIQARAHASGPDTGLRLICSQLPGVIRQVFVQPGDAVEAETPLLTVEAMKMENEIRAETAGTIEEVLVQPGDVVAARQELVKIRRERALEED